MIFLHLTSNSMGTGTTFAVDFYTRPYWSISAITKTIEKKLITSSNWLQERHVFTLQNFPNNLTDIYLVLIFIFGLLRPAYLPIILIYLLLFNQIILISLFFIHINLSNYLKQHLSLIHIDEFNFSYNIEIEQKNLACKCRALKSRCANVTRANLLPR